MARPPPAHYDLLARCQQGSESDVLEALSQMRVDMGIEGGAEEGHATSRERMEELAMADAQGWCTELLLARAGWVTALEALIDLDEALTTSGCALPTAAAADGEARSLTAATSPRLPPSPPRLPGSGNTALHVASLHNRLDAVRLLLRRRRHRLDARATNRNGDTPLLFACARGHAGVAALLLREGADAGAANAGGVTPLMAAAGHGEPVALRLLMRAVVGGGSHDDARLLCALCEAVDEAGSTALHFAASGGHAACAHLLVEASGGAPLLRRNAAGRTPAGDARGGGHAELASMLEAAAVQCLPPPPLSPTADGDGKQRQASGGKDKKKQQQKKKAKKQQPQQRVLAGAEQEARSSNDGDDEPQQAGGDASASAAAAIASALAAALPREATAEETAGGGAWSVVARKGAAAAAAGAPRPAAPETERRSGAAVTQAPTSSVAGPGPQPPPPAARRAWQLSTPSVPHAAALTATTQPAPPPPPPPRAPPTTTTAAAAVASNLATAWLDEAAELIAAACPAALDLDVQPQHVLGVGVAALSAAQIEALEAVHRAALSRLHDLRVRRADEQLAAQHAEAAALRAEIEALMTKRV